MNTFIDTIAVYILVGASLFILLLNIRKYFKSGSCGCSKQNCGKIAPKNAKTLN